MKAYLMNTNASTEVILVEGKKMFVCQIDSTGKMDGIIDVYAENAIEQLKTYFTTEPLNDFSDLNSEFVYDFIADEYDTNEPDAPSLTLICNIPNTAGRKLRELRTNKGISMDTLSKETGIPPRTIQDWEYGARKLTRFDIIVKLAEYFGVEPKEFL